MSRFFFSRIIVALEIAASPVAPGLFTHSQSNCAAQVDIHHPCLYQAESCCETGAVAEIYFFFDKANITKASGRDLNEASASNASEPSEMDDDDSFEVLAGKVRIVGFRQGLSPDGAQNHTIAVAFDIEGLDSDIDFRVEMEDGPPTFCDDVQPGQVDADYPDLQSPDVADGVWHQVAATSDANGGTEGVAYINVGLGVEELFDHPVVLYHSDDTLLACGILKQLVGEEDEVTGAGADTGTTSGTSSTPPRFGTDPSARIFFIVCCLFVRFI